MRYWPFLVKLCALFYYQIRLAQFAECYILLLIQIMKLPEMFITNNRE